MVEVPRNWDELSNLESDELIAKLNVESDAIDKLHQEGKITMEERDRRIMAIWKPFHKTGFFKHLKDHIDGLVTYEISDRKRQSCTANQYYEYRAKVEWKIIKETNWIGVFQQCIWVKPPSEEDFETVGILTNYELKDWSGFLSKVIGQFFNEDLHESQTCQLIYMHYRLLRDEITRRNLDYPFKDCLEDLKEKAQDIEKYEEFEMKLERARTDPSKCPYCGSENVGSYNRQQWYCRDCRKRWRKR